MENDNFGYIYGHMGHLTHHVTITYKKDLKPNERKTEAQIIHRHKD